MKKILKKIFEHKAFSDTPPVLLDIGASTHLPEKWKLIAGHSICIAFDPDHRQMEYIENNSSSFKKLIVIPAIVHESINGESEFYLTSSPECSSLLEPNPDELEPFYFAPLFDVEKKVQLPAATLEQVLADLEIDYVDWFKTDSQGTDLRLFKSLPDNVMDTVLAAEFEPGLIDSYNSEDKLDKILEYLDQIKFRITTFELKEVTLLNRETAAKYFSPITAKMISALMPTAPGWTEVTALKRDLNSIRDYLLSWVFATIENQPGLALQTALKGYEIFDDELFNQLQKMSIKHLKKSLISKRLFLKAMKKIGL